MFDHVRDVLLRRRVQSAARVGRERGDDDADYIRRHGARVRRLQQAEDTRGVEERLRLHERVQLVSQLLLAAEPAAGAIVIGVVLVLLLATAAALRVYQPSLVKKAVALLQRRKAIAPS